MTAAGLAPPVRLALLLAVSLAACDAREPMEGALHRVMKRCGATHAKATVAQYPLGAVLRLRVGRDPTLVCLSNAVPAEAAGRLTGKLPESEDWIGWWGRGRLHVDNINFAELTDVDVLRAKPSDTCLKTVQAHLDRGEHLVMVSRVVVGRARAKHRDEDYSRQGVLGVHLDTYLPTLLLTVLAKQQAERDRQTL